MRPSASRASMSSAGYLEEQAYVASVDQDALHDRRSLVRVPSVGVRPMMHQQHCLQAAGFGRSRQLLRCDQRDGTRLDASRLGSRAG